MASDLDEQWLYGGTETSSIDNSTPVKVKEEKIVEGVKENGEKESSERPRTPTLDDSEVALNAPSQPAVSKIISTAPDLQPKLSPSDNLAVGTATTEAIEEEGEPEEDDDEGGDSDSDDDDVEITIGEITTTAPGSYSRTPNYGRIGGAGTIGKKVDVDAIPQIGGQSLLEYDLEDSAVEKPWRQPGADIADYFNYGFTEETWKLYCEKQRKMKGEVIQLNKIVVHSSARTNAVTDSKIATAITSVASVPLPPPNILPPGFPPPPIASLPPPPFLQPPPPPPVVNLSAGVLPDDSRQTPEPKSPKDSDILGINPTPPPASDNASDGRATPGVDAPPSSNKPPLLPPPNLPPAPGLGGLPPPPFGMPPPPGFPPFPPNQENLAAAMAAAMFGGGIRPPDSLPPPHMLNNMPPFPLPPQGFSGGPDNMPPPPFGGMPPNFPVDPGAMLDDRGFPQDFGRLLGNFPWDPSMGPPPQELLDAFAHRGDRRGSRSHSRTSSGSRSRSRSSSYDERPRRKRERRHKRSRSRSRSYDREREHRHRTGRHRNGDYHRSDRHDRDRDRDRERDRESRRRREHREEKSRHERRRHRSSSRGGRDEERSSRKEKAAKAVERIEQEISRDSSKTP